MAMSTIHRAHFNESTQKLEADCTGAPRIGHKSETAAACCAYPIITPLYIDVILSDFTGCGSDCLIHSGYPPPSPQNSSKIHDFPGIAGTYRLKQIGPGTPCGWTYSAAGDWGTHEQWDSSDACAGASDNTYDIDMLYIQASRGNFDFGDTALQVWLENTNGDKIWIYPFNDETQLIQNDEGCIAVDSINKTPYPFIYQCKDNLHLISYVRSITVEIAEV